MHQDRSTLQHTCVQVFAKLDELKEMRQFVPEGRSCSERAQLAVFPIGGRAMYQQQQQQ